MPTVVSARQSIIAGVQRDIMDTWRQPQPSFDRILEMMVRTIPYPGIRELLETFKSSLPFPE